MFKSLGKGFNKLKGDINTVVGNIQSDVKSNFQLHHKKSRDDGDEAPKAQTSSIIKTLAPIAIEAATSLAAEYLTKGEVGSTMALFRKYTRGWRPRFNDALDGFFGRPTIRDTGRGSASRYDGPKKAGFPEPKTYEEVKSECLANGTLWEDPDFPATDESIYYQNPPPCDEIVWLRPGEICDDPQLFVEGASRLDVIQGVLGDCWLLAAVSCLATKPYLLHKVIPDGQGFDSDYAGVFRFMFWQYGRWVEVLIDDRLPTYNGKLIYMHSGDRNEFWSALLEKAYAKLNGCYESLSGGLTSEALTDFTGGISERYQLHEEVPDDLFKTMCKASSKDAMMACSINAKPEELESQLDNGLIIGHAYSVTSVRSVAVETPDGNVSTPLVRVRNPWGDSHEWKGAWSDESEEWQMVPDEEKESLGLCYDHDGEFWMSYDDFVKEFMNLEICYLGPDTLVDEDAGEIAEEIKKWEGTLHEGSWRRHVNAGGCLKNPSFWCNPQYQISVIDPDEDDEDGNGSIIVGLMQKGRRKLRAEGKDNLSIGFAIYKLDSPDCGTLTDRFFKTRRMVAGTRTFINMREVSDHYSLGPGHYVIVPSTFEPDVEADFVLRVFSERKDDSMKELDDEAAIAEPEAEELGEDTEDDLVRKEEGYEAFRNAAGEDGEIDAYELKDLLNEVFQKDFEFDGFSTDMCRSMIAMCDADLSGKLDFSDYQTLWGELNLCKKAFRLMDTDNSGYFNSYEFRKVLNTLGLRVSNATFNALVMRYSDKEGHIRFDDFVACVIKLKTMFETFRGKNDGEPATFAMDEFIQMTMYS